MSDHLVSFFIGALMVPVGYIVGAWWWGRRR